MMRPNQQFTGMTLIELLIVIAIMGFLSSLVVPDVRTQIERASAQEEFMRLQSELNTASFLAFSKGGNVTVIASGSEVTIFRSQLEQKRHQYSYLFFDPKQEFEYLNSGYATREKLTVTQRGRVKELDLNRSLRGGEETS